MKIDRAKFLMLTGAIGGVIAACTINSTTTNAPGGGGGGDDSGTTPGDSGSGEGGAVMEGGPRVDSGSCTDLSVGSTRECTPYVSDAGAVDAGEAGLVSNCIDALNCAAVVEDFKPAIADRIIACLALTPTCEGVASPLPGCITTAMGTMPQVGSCIDDTANAPCQEVLAACGDAGVDAGMSGPSCAAVLTGATTAGRAKFVACMVESGCYAPDAQRCFGTL